MEVDSSIDGYRLDEPISRTHPDSIKEYWILEPFCSAVILRQNNELKYKTIEPVLTEKEKEKYDTIKQLGLERVRRKKYETENNLMVDLSRKIIDEYKMNIPETSKQKIIYYVVRDTMKYGKLEPILRDPYLEEINCSGTNIPIYVNHRKYGNIDVIDMNLEGQLHSIARKLANKANKELTTADPKINGTLPDGSRLFIALEELSDRGPSFTIRKYSEKPISITQLIKNNTIPLEIAAYLWNIVEKGKHVFVAGETASGKTTTLNAISSFIPPKDKVLTLEDTREIRLYRNKWTALMTRETRDKDQTNLTLYDLVKDSLRQRPNYIIVGEVRGSEVKAMFNGMMTGHTTLSTIHGGSFQNAMSRLDSEEMYIGKVKRAEIDVVILQEFKKHLDTNQKRRLTQVTEITGFDSAQHSPKYDEVYDWDSRENKTKNKKQSEYVENKEIREKMKYLKTLVDKNITDYRRVSRKIDEFQIKNHPQRKNTETKNKPLNLQ